MDKGSRSLEISLERCYLRAGARPRERQAASG
jgi:hypothetical protein